MRGEYENNWHNAFEGTSMEPSTQVWNNIASSMDSRNGKRNWVTILLIAATVTVAFSFPLTIGNSSYEVSPQNLLITETTPALDNSETTRARDINQITTLDQSLIQKPILPLKDEKFEDVDLVKGHKELSENWNSQDVQPTSAIVKRLSYQYSMSIKEPSSGLDSYYILPIYQYNKGQKSRGMVALGSISTGSQSAAGPGGMDMLFAASADTELSNNGLENISSGSRNEEGGVSFYLGLGMEFPIGRKFSLGTGLGYLNQKLDGTSNMVYDIDGNFVPLGAYDSILPGTIFLSENYNYTANNKFISIPAYLKYPFVDRKIKFRAGLGLSTDIMVGHEIISAEYGSISYSPASTDYNTVILNGLLNIDLLLPVSENYGLAVEAGLRRGFTSIASEGNTFPTSFNLGVIIFYQFQR